MNRAPAFEVQTVYEVLRYWRDAAPDCLTAKQRRWCEVWESLDNPTAAGVSRALGVSRQAGARMQRSVIERLLSVVQKLAREKANDAALERIAAARQEYIEAHPEYLERCEARGKVWWMHWEKSAGYDDRLGREVVSGYSGHEVSEAEAAELKARGLPLRRRGRTHKASPLSRWWMDQARRLADAQGISYLKALMALHRKYSAKRPPDAEGPIYCRFCRSHLPYGETIPGSGMGRVTARREFCSNFCKTTFKRTRR